MPVNIVNLATLNRVRLYCGQPSTSEATIYTTPASTTTKVADIVLANTTNNSATISLSVVLVGGSAGANNRLFNTISVSANGVISLDTPVYLDAGDFLSATQNTANAITMTISGETYA